MRMLVWFGTFAALVVWSLLAWFLHGLVPAAADILAAAPAWLGGDATAVDLSAGIVEPLVPFTRWAVVLVWALGALLLVAAPLVLGRVARFAGRRRDDLALTALSWIERRRARRGTGQHYFGSHKPW